MTQPRLFADYAHQPTRRERTNARHEAERHQLELYEYADEPDESCPVCAGTHAEDDCTYGTAPTIPTNTQENTP